MATNEMQGLLWVFDATEEESGRSVVKWSVEVPLGFDGDLDESAISKLAKYYVGLFEAGKAVATEIRTGIRGREGARHLKWYETPPRITNWAQLGPIPVALECLERVNGGLECGYQACEGRGSGCIRR